MTTRVAYLGPAGTFTEEALLCFAAAGAFGGDEVEAVPVTSPADALDKVRTGDVARAVVAIENSVDGAVTGTYDALVDDHGGVQIYHELELPISFSIMVRPGMDPADVTSIASHPIGHQQVRHWLAANLPNAEFIPASSNAAAAEMVARGTVDAAAAPGRAAALFGLEEIARGVADMDQACTRFVVVGKKGAPTPRTGNDTTLVAFTLPNQPGSLVAALQDFAQRGIDMSRIASRPQSGQYGRYLFYVDLVGHIDDAVIGDALRWLWMRSEDILFLGSWPATRSTEVVAEAEAWVEAARTGKDTA